jgi:hypothetical protein
VTNRSQKIGISTPGPIASILFPPFRDS